MAVSEQQLITWSKPLSTTEDTKCKNAVKQVTDALRKKYGTDVTIFLQGSYENDTNVRQDSDVDIVVRYDGSYFPNLVFLNDEQKRVFDQNRTPATYTFSEFKDDVTTCLKGVFDSDVQRKNKCIYVKGNTNRVNADVVPCFSLHRMKDPYSVEAEGIKFIADDGKHIQSFPKQHYINGVSKNTRTSRMYKRTVRMLKNIRNNLIDTGVINDKFMSSFFIECLVYNVPDNNFSQYSYSQTLKNVITVVYNDMDSQVKVDQYLEVSDLQFLFKGSGRASLDAKSFMQKCWTYAGF